MERETALQTLKTAEAALKQLGIRHAGIFGSIARGDARPGSDLDILIDIDPETKMGVFRYAGIVRQIEELFPVHVDVANRARLKPLLRDSILQDAVYAF